MPPILKNEAEADAVAEYISGLIMNSQVQKKELTCSALFCILKAD